MKQNSLEGEILLSNPMLTTLLIVSIVSLVLILRYGILHGWRADKPSIKDWDVRKHQVNLEILRALLDRDDLRYVRTSLSPKEFRVLQRKRICIALRMLDLVQENSNLLVRALVLTERKCAPALGREMDEFVNSLLQLRLNLIRAKIFLYLQWVSPSLPAFSARYQKLVESFILRKTQLKMP